MKRMLQWIFVLIPMLSFANNDNGFGKIKGTVTTSDNKTAVTGLIFTGHIMILTEIPFI